MCFFFDRMLRHEREGGLLKNGPDRALRRKFADCEGLLLAGKVSCDHILEEFSHSSDPPAQEMLNLIEGVSGSEGRYGKAPGGDREFRRKTNGLIETL